MNILYIVHDNKKGGAALSFLEMISQIRSQHNVIVLTPHKNGFVPQKLDEMKILHSNAHYFWWEIEVSANPIAAIVRKMIYKLLNGWNRIEAKRWRKRIRRMKIDLIHSNSSVIDFGALLSKETRVPHVWHLREYGKHLNFTCVVSKAKYKKEMNLYATSYIAISDSIKEKFATIVDANKISRIYNGVSEKFCFEKDFSRKREEEIKFLISGNYSQAKGQTDAVRAVIELRKQGIQQFKLYLAGSGDFAEPRRLVEKHQLQDFVVFCGCVDNMVDLRKKTDVEIVATKFEAFGRVTIEAMRMSNPVIGTNTGGTPELITEGRNGFLFEYGNYMQLADYMKKYIMDRNLITRMGQNAYQDMHGTFTPEENAQQILALYEQIINCRK